MIPDLGKYGTVVLSAYGITIILILALTILSLRRARKTRAQLAALEARRKKNG